MPDSPESRGAPAARARAMGTVVMGANTLAEADAVVVVYSNDVPAGRVVRLKSGRNVVGRAEGADVELEDGRASSQHAFLFIRGPSDATWIDVSRNGSLVDGQPVQGATVAIRHGSAVRIGETTLVLSFLAGLPGAGA